MELSILLFLYYIGVVVGKIGNRLGSDDYIQLSGYPYEKHIVTTEDNYVLQLDRIPFGLKNNTFKNRPPILLVHGLGGSSTNYLILGPDKALGFQLANDGYDVWVLNCRGTFYTNHSTLVNTNPQFWNFSWHEIGVYDTPAVIDHILNVTKYEQLTYVGHSQGALAAFIVLSEKPEYNVKIKALISYSPAVFLCHSKIAVLNYLGVMEADGRLTKLRQRIGDFNVGQFSPLYSPACNKNVPTYPLCVALLHFLIDVSADSIPNGNFVSELLKYEPGGMSTKQLIHFAQSYNTCQFRHYQESPDTVPKKYNLTNVRVPVYAFSGSADLIIPTKDVILLQNNLQNGYKEYYDIPGIAHSDFVLGKYTPKLVYVKTLDIINKLYQT